VNGNQGILRGRSDQTPLGKGLPVLDTLRLNIASKILLWGERLDQLSADMDVKRRGVTVLIFFHGYSLAHTIRPLVLARALRGRGYSVALAGRGPHVNRVRREDFVVHDVETLPQKRMDEFVNRSDYGYYDTEWIDRCVRSERLLMQMVRPDLVIHDMKPTVSLSAQLEGVDDARITQAYNQPGYPFPIRLMDRFSIEGGPFDQYLAERAAEVKEQNSFFLLADIPEFHPPGREVAGFHYVGPLLDRPSSPEKLAVLDEGWDTSLPLIYLTCGSSGRAPDYLDRLIDAIRDKPYRLLVTTAGRWTGKAPSERVRVVDFLPGEWVLERAKVLIGIVGIGAIYQALRCGVPIIGAPEHLDQEYHLNRVEGLGLGIKLDRREFDAEGILAALERVLADYDGFKKRCTPFARHLGKWDGEGVVVDLVRDHFRACEQEFRAEQPYLETEEEFLRYLDMTTPETLSRETLKELVREGVKKGLPCIQRGNETYLDHLDSWNWLNDNEPRFFEADYRALEKKRQRFFIRENGHLRSRNAWQRYRIQYRFRLIGKGLETEQRIKFFLPYPILREGQQRNIGLQEMSPTELKNCLAPSLGFLYGFQFEVGEGMGFGDFGYTCELEVGEMGRKREDEADRLTGRERGKYLKEEPGLADRVEVKQFRRDLAGKVGGRTTTRAREIYRHLVRMNRFKKTKDQTQGFTYSTVNALKGLGGHCITLSRAFIALCRMEGIPAREVSGALIGYPIGENRYAMRNYCEPIFGHTWAEFYEEGRGWKPVEFHGIVVAERALTGANTTDAQLRKSIRGNSDGFLDYYFGHVDNQRIICSNAVKKIPEFLVENPDFPEGHRKRWQWSPEVKYECHLEVERL
jgi:UDP:flavonoid glycosyltransferase YjiC (YdhE family)